MGCDANWLVFLWDSNTKQSGEASNRQLLIKTRCTHMYQNENGVVGHFTPKLSHVQTRILYVIVEPLISDHGYAGITRSPWWHLAISFHCRGRTESILHQLEFMKPYEYREPPTNWCRILSISWFYPWNKKPIGETPKRTKASDRDPS